MRPVRAIAERLTRETQNFHQYEDSHDFSNMLVYYVMVHLLSNTNHSIKVQNTSYIAKTFTYVFNFDLELILECL